MNTLDDSNESFRLAVDLVNQSNRNIFLTGKAGTGKTTFLRHIKEHSLKQVAVVAPTGVAAINAGGATIHSFFQLPFSPFLPDPRSPAQQADANNKHTLFGKMKMSRERIKVIQQLELLIIDEISMVRCDTLDAIDLVLRHFRHRNTEPFGGVQVLLIGDMYQLPPVVPNNEWSLLSQFYSSPYFFDSRIIQLAPPVYVEFQKIYRQTDSRFIELLNQVRNNQLSPQGKQLLDSLYHPALGEFGDGAIVLTTHNYKADAINEAELQRLSEKLYSFEATIEGDFNEKAYPADEMLRIKPGAQVMFIKNDREKVRRYYNGKIGVVSRVTDGSVYVQCKDETAEIEVQKETWENIRYTVNKDSNQVEEEVVGSFTQYPLRLAWAITIHKSQGLTFEKAVIDAGDAFAAGQVYVALSRCTSITGIVLQSKVTPSSLSVDETIVQFSNNLASTELLKEELQRSKKQYQESMLMQVFDMSPPLRYCGLVKMSVQDHLKDFNEPALQWVQGIVARLTNLRDISNKFKSQLAGYNNGDTLPENNPGLQARIGEGCGYFEKEFDDIYQALANSPVVTESKVQAKVFNETLKDLAVSIAEKRSLLRGFKHGFSVAKYYQVKKEFVVPPFTVNAYATASEEFKEMAHPALHYQLRQLRNKICEQRNVPIYMVANGKTIDEMTTYLPQTMDEIIRVSGFGKAKAEHYGQQFLDVIAGYCSEYGLESTIHLKNSKKERKQKSTTGKKTDTKAATLKLYSAGKSIPEIATERNLAVSTIESHLAFFVSQGTIPVEALVDKQKLALIAPYMIGPVEGGLTPIKEKLGDSVSYSELRMAMAAKEWEQSKIDAGLPQPVST